MVEPCLRKRVLLELLAPTVVVLLKVAEPTFLLVLRMSIVVVVVFLHLRWHVPEV